MQPMSTFDPEKPCRVHDRLNDRTIDWRTSWADNWREYAIVASDGVADWDGLILDRWTGVRGKPVVG